MVTITNNTLLIFYCLIDLFIVRYDVQLVNFSIVTTFIFSTLLRSIHSKKALKYIWSYTPHTFSTGLFQKIFFPRTIGHWPNWLGQKCVKNSEMTFSQIFILRWYLIFCTWCSAERNAISCCWLKTFIFNQALVLDISEFKFWYFVILRCKP